MTLLLLNTAALILSVFSAILVALSIIRFYRDCMVYRGRTKWPIDLLLHVPLVAILIVILMIAAIPMSYFVQNIRAVIA